MARFAWATDIHLDSVESPGVEAFCAEVRAADVAGLLLTGDIAEADSVVGWLTKLQSELELPIYFVLGNHDYYGGSVREVRDAMRALDTPGLFYLPDTGPVELSPDVTLVGHDGWGDCRIGDLEEFVTLTDYMAIEDLRDTLDLDAMKDGVLDRSQLREKLQELGDDAAAILSPHLVQAAGGGESGEDAEGGESGEASERGGTVLVLTHIPPFRESCWYDGQPSAPAYLPGFTCKAVGDVLSDVAHKESSTRFVVLCGHTHSNGHAQILPNLEVHVGFGHYRGLYLGFVDIDGAEVRVQAPVPAPEP